MLDEPHAALHQPALPPEIFRGGIADERESAESLAGIPQFNGTGLAGNVIARSSLLAPFPQFNGVSYFRYDRLSWYDALNVRLRLDR